MKKTISEERLLNIINASVTKHLNEVFNTAHREGNTNHTSFDQEQENSEKYLMKELLEIRAKMWKLNEFIQKGVDGTWGWNLSPKVADMGKDIEVMIERMFKELDPEMHADYSKFHSVGTRLSTDTDDKIGL